jgi:hypothetical protein
LHTTLKSSWSSPSFVNTLETKGLKLLRNAKTHWISMLRLLKRVLAQDKSLVVKMHFDCVKSKYAHDNFELLGDLNLILGLPCVMPILKVVHSLIEYAQRWDVFIMDFLDVIIFTKAKLFHLYTNPYFSFDDPLFDIFTKLL